jgi:hypothetical protein
VPTDGDTVIIPEDVSVSIVTNVDQTGVDLAALITDKGYVGNLGASGAPLKIAADKVTHRGSGILYFYSGMNTATVASNHETTDWVLIDSDGGANIDGISITRITAEKGIITLAGSLGETAHTNQTGTLPEFIEIAHRNNPASDVGLTNNAACKASTGTMRIAGGQITTAGAVPIMEIAGGIVTHNDGSAITTLTMTGGYLYYDSKEALVTAHVFAGAVLDLSANSLQKTITTLNVYSGGTVIMDDDLVTVANENIMGTGRKIRPAPGDGVSPFGGRQAVPV